MNQVIARVVDETIFIYTLVPFSDFDPHGLMTLPKEMEPQGDFTVTSFTLTGENALALRKLSRQKEWKLFLDNDQERRALTLSANSVPKSSVSVSRNGEWLNIKVPRFPPYAKLMRSLGAKFLAFGYSIPLSATQDFLEGYNLLPEILKDLEIAQDVTAIYDFPLPKFDGTMESFEDVPLSSLRALTTARTTYEQKKIDSILEGFQNKGLETLEDLAYYVPRRYIDLNNQTDSLDYYMEGEPASIGGTIDSIVHNVTRTGHPITKLTLKENPSLDISFYRGDWLSTSFSSGDQVVVYGKVKTFQGRKSLSGSNVYMVANATMYPMVPVWKQSVPNGVTGDNVSRALREAFTRMGDIEWPTYMKPLDKDMSLGKALKALHFPKSQDEILRALDTLAYRELVYMHMEMMAAKKREERAVGIPLHGSNEDLQTQLIENLPYSLTGSQARAVESINSQVSQEHPVEVMLNADVGAGKTVVATLAALRAVDSGYQAILVAPTEVLARQLETNVRKMVEPLGVHVTFLGGAMKVRESRKARREIEDGTAQIIIGTHSLLEPSVVYKNLGYVVYDELQKFGANQRTAVLLSREDKRVPHMLMQSATPIPRSIAQAVFGDIEQIVLEEKPPGRKDIETLMVLDDPQEVIHQADNPIWQDLQAEFAQGRQAFVVTPLVEEDDKKVEAASVKGTLEALRKIMPKAKIEAVHGGVKADELRDIMARFKAGEFDCIVGSSVIEVGVDIPMATRMVILSANRFGASSLHQIRGRVGRNSLDSRCYLVSHQTHPRLEALVAHQDGYKIAEIDLLIRGEGAINSTNQSGDNSMRFANVVAYSHLLDKSLEEARRIMDSPFAVVAQHDAEKIFKIDYRRV